MGKYPILSDQSARWPTSFKVRPITAASDEDTRVLHRNMLLPIKTSEEHTFTCQENAQSMALMKANLLMDIVL